MRTGGDRLRNISGKPNTAIGNDRHPGILEPGGNLGDGADLRHADPGDDARRADRARADTDLDAVGAGLDQLESRLARNHVTGNELEIRI